MSAETQLAERIIKKLKLKGVNVLRYDSRSSRSIYLKFDYGMAFSLRISDHPSRKKHLKYRYNLLTSNDKVRIPRSDKRYYYRPSQLSNLLYKILKERQKKQAKYGNKYHEFMAINKLNLGDCKNGFWKSCKEA